MGGMPPILQQMMNIPIQRLEQEAMRSLQMASKDNQVAKSILDNLQNGNREEAFNILGNAAKNYNIDVNRINGMRR